MTSLFVKMPLLVYLSSIFLVSNAHANSMKNSTLDVRKICSGNYIHAQSGKIKKISVKERSIDLGINCYCAPSFIQFGPEAHSEAPHNYTYLSGCSVSDPQNPDGKRQAQVYDF